MSRGLVPPFSGSIITYAVSARHARRWAARGPCYWPEELGDALPRPSGSYLALEERTEVSS